MKRPAPATACLALALALLVALTGCVPGEAQGTPSTSTTTSTAPKKPDGPTTVTIDGLIYTQRATADCKKENGKTTLRFTDKKSKRYGQVTGTIVVATNNKSAESVKITTKKGPRGAVTLTTGAKDKVKVSRSQLVYQVSGQGKTVKSKNKGKSEKLTFYATVVCQVF